MSVLGRCRFMLGFSWSKSMLLGDTLSLVLKSVLKWSARLGNWSLWKPTQQKGKRQTDSFQLDQFPGLADAHANRRTKVGTGVRRKWKYPVPWQFEINHLIYITTTSRVSAVCTEIVRSWDEEHGELTFHPLKYPSVHWEFSANAGKKSWPITCNPLLLILGTVCLKLIS